MRKLSKKALSAVLASMMLLSIASCSGGDTNTDTTSNGGSTADTSSTADSGSGSGKVQLRFTSWANTGEIAVLQRAVDAYNELQDNVEVVFESSASDTYEQKLITALSGGTAWDVFYAGDSTIIKLIENGSIMKLNDFMATDDSYCKEEDFAEGLWGAARTDDGSIYGLTVDCNPNLLYYQPAMLEEVGAEDPQALYEAGTWTWEAFSEINQKLLDSGREGYLFGGDTGTTYSWIATNKGNIWTDTTYGFDDAAVEALHYIEEELNAGRWYYSGLLPQGQGEDAQFISGLCGFTKAGRWNTPTFNEAGIEHDYIPFPTSDGSKNPAVQIATAYCAVNAESANVEEAMKFATYYCSEDGQRVRLEETDGKPGNAVPAVNGCDDIIENATIPEHASYLLEVRSVGWAIGSPWAKDARYPGMDTELKAILEETWVDGASIDDTITKVEEKANEIVAENS